MWEGIDISGKWRLFSMVFNGSGSIVRNQNKSWKFRNYEILRKSEEIKRNFFNKKASDIHKYFPGNWTRPNDEVPYIRDGLMMVGSSLICTEGSKISPGSLVILPKPPTFISEKRHSVSISLNYFFFILSLPWGTKNSNGGLQKFFW